MQRDRILNTREVAERLGYYDTSQIRRWAESGLLQGIKVGRDWLFDHLVQFPSSPVEEIVDLQRSVYGLAAIVKDVAAVDVVRLADKLDDSRGELAALLGPADIGLNDGEFIAADARDEIGLRHRRNQADSHKFQQLVANRVAERVVDGLEMIEVEAMHGEAAAGLNAIEGVFEVLAEQHAVG